jgi:Ca2+-binding EF-hand superfamily protein
MALAYKDSPVWVKRMEEFFVQSDLNKDGYLLIEDFEMWSDNIEREVKPEASLLKKLHEATPEYWEAACGLKPGVQLTKDQFIENMSKFSAAEKARFDDGKTPLVYPYLDASFDAVDINRDGYLQLDEYKKFMKASNFDAGTAKNVFDIIDTNHDGKLSREELKSYYVKFWFTPNDPEAAGMFGAKFEHI